MTHTYAIMEVSREAYREIRARLEVADYGHAIQPGGELDMRGIALMPDKTQTAAPCGHPLSSISDLDDHCYDCAK